MCEIGLIRRKTRVSLPSDDGYVFRLGVALYGFCSLTSFLAEITCRFDSSIDRNELEPMTAGKILACFRKSAEKLSQFNSGIDFLTQRVSVLFENLNHHRSDFVHSYPTTNKMGEQILLRRYDDKGKYFEIDNNFLDEFLYRINEVSDCLYGIRKIIEDL